MTQMDEITLKGDGGKTFWEEFQVGHIMGEAIYGQVKVQVKYQQFQAPGYTQMHIRQHQDDGFLGKDKAM